VEISPGANYADIWKRSGRVFQPNPRVFPGVATPHLDPSGGSSPSLAREATRRRFVSFAGAVTPPPLHRCTAAASLPHPGTAVPRPPLPPPAGRLDLCSSLRRRRSASPSVATPPPARSSRFADAGAGMHLPTSTGPAASTDQPVLPHSASSPQASSQQALSPGFAWSVACVSRSKNRNLRPRSSI